MSCGFAGDQDEHDDDDGGGTCDDHDDDGGGTCDDHETRGGGDRRVSRCSSGLGHVRKMKMLNRCR